MLKNIRRSLAAICFVAITLLFLDFTGTLARWLGWLAKIQLLPALLALNVAVVATVVIATLLFGRIYCSVVCPLGVFQDLVSWIAGKRHRNRFSYSPARNALRYGVLALFVAALGAGLGSVFALLAPYSAYGRMVSTLLSPVYLWGNNLLALLAERLDSYAFYSVDVWLKSASTMAVALVTFVVLSALAWRKGRAYCNTICPVGTALGFAARLSLFKPRIDPDKCTGCGLCARNCKASCIDSEAKQIDSSRCVVCLSCTAECRKGAIGFSLGRKEKKPAPSEPAIEVASASRRQFLSATALAAVSVAGQAQAQKVDGGLALIREKKAPERATPIAPAGAGSLRDFKRHCTACQLCVSVCPNQVLRPSDKVGSLMQPEMSYERGYCRPECAKCSEVCPTGAIHPVTVAEKSAIQIGHAVWVAELCLNTSGVNCSNCARHCPSGAIRMTPRDAGDPSSAKFPMIDAERCIGCGACEFLCPARPSSAIHVEGHESHRTV